MAKSSKQKNRSPLIFKKQNYLMLLLSVVLIVVGFVAMWMEGEFLGVISLNVSPVVIMAGYAGVICAILWQPGNETEAEEAA